MKLSKTVSKIERVAAGMVLVDSFDFSDFFDAQLWADGKARKSSTCILTGKGIRPGDRIYRPVGNAHNRSRRMLAVEVDKAAPVETGIPCNMCKTPMDQPGKPATLNCGGDCRKCMAEAGDPDCIRYFRNHPVDVTHG